MPETTANNPKLRNARACEACRAVKSRCVYKNQQGICQRCEQTGSECIVRSKARPMRSRATRPFLAQNNNHSSPSSGSGFSIHLPTVSTPDVSDDVAALHQRHKEFFDDEDSSENKPLHLLNEDSKSEQGQRSLIQQREVTLSQAEQLLSSFRKKAAFFPFVFIPLTATVSSLARTSPFLLLAILTTASRDDPQLYCQMNHEFRRVLSSKIIVEGRKSLDFLQGLLVYIAWYPIHSNPKNNQSFMYMNLAISLIVDLGLDRAAPNTNNFSSINTKGLIENGEFTTAAKRAYLGCYYMSSALSLGFQKPNNLQYRNLMDTRGEELLQDENSTDIYSMVKLQRLAERIAEMHTSNQLAVDLHMQALSAEMNIQLFLNELQEWGASTFGVVRTSPSIGIAEMSAGIAVYSHELGFLRRPYRDHLLSPATASQSHLSSCLEACKKFFEYLLSIPQDAYPNFTTVQWCHVVQAILVLSRLTFLMASKMGWDADTTRSNIPLVVYLDCLCYRFQQLSSTQSDNEKPPKNPDGLYVFKMIMGSVKRSYERRVAKIAADFFTVEHGNVVGDFKGHCPMLDPNLTVYFDPGTSTYDGSFGLDGSVTSSSSTSTVPLYHDLWATMTGSWAEGFD